MSCKHALGGLMLVLLCAMMLPQHSYATDWTVSPFRAQFTDGQVQEEETADDTAITVNASGKKNIGKGVLFSLVIPGTGQLYGGNWLRALPWFAVEVAGWAAFSHFHGQGQSKTDEFEAYAGPRGWDNNWNGIDDTPYHFSYRSYMFYEWSVASDPVRNQGRDVTELSYQDWLQEEWTNREQHLPPPFTHDVLTNDEQQYYEMIGKYLLQFGFGWIDTWSGSPGAPDWTQPDAGLNPDNPATVEFDGDSPMFFHYRDMRGEANELLDKGNVAMEVVLVNHILSALDAAFTVRSYNKRVTATPEPDLGELHLRYDARPEGYDAGKDRRLTARMLSLSLPLD